MLTINYMVQRVDVDQAQLATWAGQVAGHQMHLSGSCPVCAHDSAIVVSQEFTAREAAAASKIAALSITCACDQSHPGQPDGISGCGRHWSCTATIGGDNRVTLSVLNDPALAAAADAFRAAGETQLADLRSAAQKWIGGVTALFSLFGLAGVALSRSAVAGLVTGWQVAIAFTAAVSIGLAALSVFRIYRAAYGWPVTRAIKDNYELLEWYAAREAAPRLQAGYLKDGVRAAAAALAVLVVTVGLLWFAPEAQPSVPMVQVTLTNGTLVCGTLLPATPGATLVRASDGNSITVPARSIESLTVVADCGSTTAGPGGSS